MNFNSFCMIYLILSIILMGDKMFYKHSILNVNGEDVLYLYISDYQEFSKDFKSYREKETLYEKIKNYIENMHINFNGRKIMFVVNGLIIGSMMLATSNFSGIIKDNNEVYPFLNIDQNYIIEKPTNKKDKFQTEDEHQNSYTIISNTQKEIEQESPNQKQYKTVLIKDEKGKLENIIFDYYLTNIMAMKIPPTYNDEALKAMAVLLRTEAFKEIYENKYLSSNNQFHDINYFKHVWKEKFDLYYNRLYQIVLATNNQYLSYHNYFLNTLSVNDPTTYTVRISNYGANLMAKAGYNYIDILKHYYPNTNIYSL